MPFNLKEFTSEMHKSGIARPSYFMMMVNLPAALIQQFPDFGKTITFRVESAQLPTRIIVSHDQRYYGPIRRVPYGFLTQDLTFTVILSEDYREREIFLRWQDLLVGNSRTRKDGFGESRAGMFDSGYYNDGVKSASVELRTYATTPLAQSQGAVAKRSFLGEVQDIAQAVGLNTSVLTAPLGFNLLSDPDREINAAYSIKLVEPFPININEVPLSWADDGYARVHIIMQYRYTEETCSFAPNAAADSSIGGFIRNGMQQFEKFKPIISLIRNEGIGGAIDTIGGQIKTNFLSGIKALGAGL